MYKDNRTGYLRSGWNIPTIIYVLCLYIVNTTQYVLRYTYVYGLLRNKDIYIWVKYRYDSQRFRILRLTNKGTKDHKIKCILIVNWTISLQLNKTDSCGPFKETCYTNKPIVKVHESYKFVYQCHKWSRICSTCRKHFAVLSWFMTYHVHVTRS